MPVLVRAAPTRRPVVPKPVGPCEWCAAPVTPDQGHPTWAFPAEDEPDRDNLVLYIRMCPECRELYYRILSDGAREQREARERQED